MAFPVATTSFAQRTEKTASSNNPLATWQSPGNAGILPASERDARAPNPFVVPILGNADIAGAALTGVRIGRGKRDTFQRSRYARF